MVNLSLIEFKQGKNKEEKISTNFSYGYMTNCSKNNLLRNSFLINCPNSETYKTQVKVVNNKFARGTYELNDGYTILYLYDFLNDDESIKFLKTYGGRIHNKSSSNVTVLTYFEENYVKQWQNVLNRSQISCNDLNYSDIIDIFVYFKNEYKIQNLPAMVIIKKDEEMEQNFNIELPGRTAEHIYNAMSEVISILVENCEEDFSIIANKISGNNEISKNNRIRDFELNAFLDDVSRRYRNENNKKITFTDLAIKLNITDRQLRNKKNNRAFSREECLMTAVILNLKIDETNNFLRATNNTDLGFSGRDGIIRQCLIENLDLYQTNEELEKRYFRILSNE